MNIQEIRKLLEMFDNSSSVKLRLTSDNFTISLKKPTQESTKPPKTKVQKAHSSHTEAPPETLPESPLPPAPSIGNANAESILSPMVGTFYRAPSPDSAPYVNVGDKVKKGQTIAIIEAMKIMNEIEAEFDCKILEVVANDAQSVEFSTELFVVEKI